MTFFDRVKILAALAWRIFSPIFLGVFALLWLLFLSVSIYERISKDMVEESARITLLIAFIAIAAPITFEIIKMSFGAVKKRLDLLEVLNGHLVETSTTLLWVKDVLGKEIARRIAISYDIEPVPKFETYGGFRFNDPDIYLRPSYRPLARAMVNGIAGLPYDVLATVSCYEGRFDEACRRLEEKLKDENSIDEALEAAIVAFRWGAMYAEQINNLSIQIPRTADEICRWMKIPIPQEIIEAIYNEIDRTQSDRIRELVDDISEHFKK